MVKSCSNFMDTLSSLLLLLLLQPGCSDFGNTRLLFISRFLNITNIINSDIHMASCVLDLGFFAKMLIVEIVSFKLNKDPI